MDSVHIDIDLEKMKLEKDSFQRFLLISFLAHGIFIIAFSLKPLIFSSERIEIKNAIQVDIVGLPEKVKPKPLPAEKNEPPKVKIKEKNAKNKNSEKKKIKDIKNKQADALKRINALAAIEKSKKLRKKKNEMKHWSAQKKRLLKRLDKK